MCLGLDAWLTTLAAKCDGCVSFRQVAATFLATALARHHQHSPPSVLTSTILGVESSSASLQRQSSMRHEHARTRIINEYNSSTTAISSSTCLSHFHWTNIFFALMKIVMERGKRSSGHGRTEKQKNLMEECLLPMNSSFDFIGGTNRGRQPGVRRLRFQFLSTMMRSENTARSPVILF